MYTRVCLLTVTLLKKKKKHIDSRYSLVYNNI